MSSALLCKNLYYYDIECEVKEEQPLDRCLIAERFWKYNLQTQKELQHFFINILRKLLYIALDIFFIWFIISNTHVSLNHNYVAYNVLLFMERN